MGDTHAAEEGVGMRQRDRIEFEGVFDACYHSVLHTAFVILHDRGRAEEVTQDAFLKLYERWNDANRIERPGAWVRTVAVHAAVRRAQRELSQSITLIDQPADADPLPDVDLRRALAVLTPRQRAAVALYYLEDRPVDEIADLMGVSTSTVKQHLFRARSELAALLTETQEEATRYGD
ncbi:putative RNA polymerase ECF sigma factor [metagenome]|uniref:Putative RNA polymerase ECF sigma factor n=1 Tax=metagenome TaxID=256318 RepID=A0A2P2BZT6_9ZZZZ